MEHDSRINEGFERLAKVEASADSSHKRIDSVASSNKELWDRVRGNETEYMPRVKKADEAHEGVLQMSVTLDNLLQSITALHKRNDEKDKSDAEAYVELKLIVKGLADDARQRDITEAEARGARKIKNKIIAWVSTSVFGFIVLFAIWIVSSINDLKVANAKSHVLETKAVKKEDTTPGVEHD